MPCRGKAPLVPELGCHDVLESLAFYTEILGFRILYKRVEKGFYYLERQGSEIMIEQLDDRSWLAAPAEKPLGRGISFEIMTPDLDGLYQRCKAKGAPVFMEREEAWYRADAQYLGQAQFIIQDPDGYLLRFAENLGARADKPATGRVVS